MKSVRHVTSRHFHGAAKALFFCFDVVVLQIPICVPLNGDSIVADE